MRVEIAKTGVKDLRKITDIIKSILIFKEPKEVEKFVLEEDKNEDGNSSTKEKSTKKEANSEPGSTQKRENWVTSIMTAPFVIDKEKKGGEKGDKDENSKKESKNSKNQKDNISKKISENLDYIKKKYSIPTNGDIVLREFDITVKDRTISAFAVFIDGMTDRMVINHAILQPLMMLSNLDIKGNPNELGEYIKKHLLPQGQLNIFNTFEKVISEVNFGGCAVFIDGLDVAFTADVKGWEHRGVERPNTELVIRGPQEGFTEVLRVNTALVRKILKDEDLIVENVEIGRRSKTPCSMLYIKDIANEKLVNEVRRRLKSIKIDYLQDSGELEQLIEDSTILHTPQMIDTERPDRVASMLAEGKVAVIVNGSPFALVMPATATELFRSAEDSYVRFPYGNFFKFIRIIGLFITLLLPGFYIATINYHVEMIPTDLLLAIEASRERVPFPSIVEILILEISFELIREAGIRIPGPIGPTLGIIGALILGQAAVAANIVSPILIIVVAVTGIGSFSIPSFSLAFSLRVLRFGYILLGTLAGFLGFTTGLFIHLVTLVNAKSFGVPFMVPIGPRTSDRYIDDIVRAPVWKQEKRPDYLNTKDVRKQPHISRGWVRDENRGDKENE